MRRSRIRTLLLLFACAGLFVIGQSWLWRLHRFIGVDPLNLLVSLDTGQIGIERGGPDDNEQSAAMADAMRSASSPFQPAVPFERLTWPEFMWSNAVFRLGLPAWTNASFFAFVLLLALFFPSLRRRRWNRCRCGYDLRGNVSDRCPECGRSIIKVSVDPPVSVRS